MDELNKGKQTIMSYLIETARGVLYLRMDSYISSMTAKFGRVSVKRIKKDHCLLYVVSSDMGEVRYNHGSLNDFLDKSK